MTRLSANEPRRDRAIELRRRGVSVGDICTKLGARRETVLMWTEGVQVQPPVTAPAPYAVGYRWGLRRWG